MSHGPESLLAAIQRGGPLADLFRRASQDVRTALERLLRPDWAAEIVGSIAREARERLDEGVAASPLAVLRQCSAGCSACCHTVSADITPLEALVVAEHLQATVVPAALATIRARLRENATRRASMTAEERSRVRLRCGLLGDDGLCQVYAVRPLVCAGVFSLSRGDCQSAATSGNPEEQYVPLDRPAKAWTMGVSGGLQRALVEAGLDGNLYELNSIVLCAVETPHASQRWLEREDIFQGCICTDAHSPPRAPLPDRRADAAHQGVPAPAMLRRGARRTASQRDTI